MNEAFLSGMGLRRAEAIHTTLVWATGIAAGSDAMTDEETDEDRG